MKNAEALVKELIKQNKHICCAESCTGGMLSSSLIDVPCASGAVDMGFVTYADTAKIRLLGVDASDIEKHGVVSEPVAVGMAVGAARVSGAEVGVGISGIAGPTGATPGKPLGTVCFGYSIDGKTYSETVHFGEIGRQNVREHSCEHAINFILEHISIAL